MMEPGWFGRGKDPRGGCGRSAGQQWMPRELQDSQERVSPSLHGCQGSMRSLFHDAVRLRAGRRGAALVETQPGVTRVGISWALVLAIGVWIVERAIAGF